MEDLEILRFGRVELQVERRRLWQDGTLLAIGARAFDLLVALVERRDRIVTKDELLDVVWPGLVVEENNLQVQISSAAQAARPAGHRHRFPGAATGSPPRSTARRRQPSVRCAESRCPRDAASARRRDR